MIQEVNYQKYLQPGDQLLMPIILSENAQFLNKRIFYCLIKIPTCRKISRKTLKIVLFYRILEISRTI